MNRKKLLTDMFDSAFAFEPGCHGCAQAAVKAVAVLHRKFHSHYGRETCRAIQTSVVGRPFDVLQEQDVERFEGEQGHAKVCPEVVGTAVCWIAELLRDQGLKPRSA